MLLFNHLLNHRNDSVGLLTNEGKGSLSTWQVRSLLDQQGPLPVKGFP